MLLTVRLAGVTAAVGRLLVMMVLHLLVRLRRSVIRRIRVLLLLLLLLWWGVARWARIRRIVGHSWRANRNVHGARGRLGSKTEDVMKGKVR